MKSKQYTYGRDVTLRKAKVNESLARWLMHDQAQPVASRNGENRRNHVFITAYSKIHSL